MAGDARRPRPDRRPSDRLLGCRGRRHRARRPRPANPGWHHERSAWVMGGCGLLGRGGRERPRRPPSADAHPAIHGQGASAHRSGARTSRSARTTSPAPPASTTTAPRSRPSVAARAREGTRVAAPIAPSNGPRRRPRARHLPGRPGRGGDQLRTRRRDHHGVANIIQQERHSTHRPRQPGRARSPDVHAGRHTATGAATPSSHPQRGQDTQDRGTIEANPRPRSFVGGG